LRSPYDPTIVDPKGAALHVLRARALLRKIERRLLRGDIEGAKTNLLAVYLEEVEPLEAPLRAADPSLVTDLETMFKELRADVDRGAPAVDVEHRMATLSQTLGRAGQVLGSKGD